MVKAPTRSVGDVVYDVVGSGPVPALLLHGGSGRREWFDAMAGLLLGDLVMVRPDLPGHGQSRATPGRYRLEDFAAVAAAVVEHSGVGPVWVFGHSHGAHVAAVLAADRPDLVRGVIIGDAPMSLERMREHQTATAGMNRAWRELTEPSLSAEERREAFLRLRVGGPGDEQTIGDIFGADHPYVAEMVTSLGSHDGDFLDAVLVRFDETYRRLGSAPLASVDVPVVVVQADGAAGGLLTDADVAYVRDQVGEVPVHRLQGVGHGLQLQDPGQVAEVLRARVRA